MSRPVGSKLLLDLASRINRVTLTDVVAPDYERPHDAQVLGYAPFSLQQIYTVYALLSKECDGSAAAREEAAATKAAIAASRRNLSEDELEPYYTAVQVARAKLCQYETMIDLLWVLFLAEAARIFPSDGYVEHAVTVYSDWSVAIRPDNKDESDAQEDADEPMVPSAEAPPRRLLN